MLINVADVFFNTMTGKIKIEVAKNRSGFC